MLPIKQNIRNDSNSWNMRIDNTPKILIKGWMFDIGLLLVC